MCVLINYNFRKKIPIGIKFGTNVKSNINLDKFLDQNDRTMAKGVYPEFFLLFHTFLKLLFTLVLLSIHVFSDGGKELILLYKYNALFF